MASEPDNLVLELLREMRGNIVVLRERAEEHSEQLKRIRKDMHEWQETTAIAVGFALHANLRHETLDQKRDELTKRIEMLEKGQ